MFIHKCYQFTIWLFNMSFMKNIILYWFQRQLGKKQKVIKNISSYNIFTFFSPFWLVAQPLHHQTLMANPALKVIDAIYVLVYFLGLKWSGWVHHPKEWILMQCTFRVSLNWEEPLKIVVWTLMGECLVVQDV